MMSKIFWLLLACVVANPKVRKKVRTDTDTHNYQINPPKIARDVFTIAAYIASLRPL